VTPTPSFKVTYSLKASISQSVRAAATIITELEFEEILELQNGATSDDLTSSFKVTL